jgi:hypothetical protein
VQAGGIGQNRFRISKLKNGMYQTRGCAVENRSGVDMIFESAVLLANRGRGSIWEIMTGPIIVDKKSSYNM